MSSLSRGLTDRIKRYFRPPPLMQFDDPDDSDIPVMEWDGILVVHATPHGHLNVSEFLNQEMLQTLGNSDSAPPRLPTTRQAGNR